MPTVWMDDWVLGRSAQLWPTFLNTQGQACPYLLRVFESKTTCVVLARSNDPGREVNEAYCAAHHIPVLRRRGGGGTVVLGPGCQIVTFAFFASSLFENALYFSLINAAWISAIESVTGAKPGTIAQRGISDLAIGDKKVAGTSLFRRKHLLVFQGSLLVNPDFQLIASCLCHPSREPEYRKGRNHSEFLGSLYTHKLWNGKETQELCEKTQAQLQIELLARLRKEAVTGW